MKKVNIQQLQKVTKVFLSKIQQGKPCCGIYLYINRKEKQLYRYPKWLEKRARQQKGSYLTIRLNKIKEQLLFLTRQAMGLKLGFFDKTQLPILMRWSITIKDAVISLFPDQPSTQHEDFHEERIRALYSCCVHHLMEAKIELPMKTKLSSTFPAEGAKKEQMKSGFLPVLPV